MQEQMNFEEWAILELMGHRRLAGKVTEAVIGGGAFLRIDIPGRNGKQTTQYYSPGSVYCITPTTEEIARAVAAQNEPAPVYKWELPQLKSNQTDEDKKGDIIHCPRCGEENRISIINEGEPGSPYYCGVCDKRFQP